MSKLSRHRLLERLVSIGATPLHEFHGMRPADPNPFRDATFTEIQRACNDAVRELDERRQRSRDEKEAFAKRLRFLLLVVAMRFSTGSTIPDSPEMPLDRSSLETVPDAFLRWYQRTAADELRTIRKVTLWRAADFVLGKEAENWLNPGWVLWSERRGFLGARDEDNLAVILQELETLRRNA